MIQNKKISALAIVFNEEHNIRDYLNNYAFADEIIVVDSFSSDATLDIIEKEFPHVQIHKRVFDNFSSQRNFAISKAANDWVIFFDADERIDVNGILELTTAVSKSTTEVAFWIKRQLYFKKIKYIMAALIKTKPYAYFENQNVIIRLN